jgi:integrase
VKVAGERGIYRRRTPNGWRYEITFADSDGRQRWRVIDGDLKAARAARGDVLAKIGRGERVAPSKRTLAEVADAFFESHGSTLRPRTLDIYRSNLTNHVLPKLGRRRVASISEDDIARLIGDLSHLSPWSVHGVLTALSRVLGYAARRGLIASNPVRRLERGERPSIAPSEKRILGHDEIAALLDAADDAHRPLLATAVYTGLRLGELLGLRWQDIDFERGFVRVRYQLDRRAALVEPKTVAAKRDVVLLPALGRVLREHRLASPFSAATDHVFTSSTGSPKHWRNVVIRGLDRAAAHAGLVDPSKPKLTMHALRNTFASHTSSST